MSLVLRLGIPTRVAARITQTAAVAVAKALGEMGVEAKIKWPNDLLVRGRKICGILAESSIENVPVAAKRVGSGEGRQVDFVVLGVGLNADLDPQDLGVVENEATTLRSELGRDVDLLAVLGSVLSHLDFELGRIDDFESILEDWRALRYRPLRFERATLERGPVGRLRLEP